MELAATKVSPTSIWRDQEEVPDPFQEIRRLGLEENVAELDTYGYTVVSPELVGPADFALELRNAVLRVAEKRGGTHPDLATGDSHRNMPTAAGQHIYNMLLEGPLFEQAVTNRTALALITYLLGESCLISSMTSMIKGPGNVRLDLHSDVLLIPPPYPFYATAANATWVLTDYSRENGSTCFWPGSHKFCRQPTPEERDDTASLVPVEARAGSLLVWHSNTWHGAFARTAPGLRVNLINFYCRPFMFQQEVYRGRLSQEVLDRNIPRFATLIGSDLAFPMGIEGPDRDKLARLNAATRTLWG